MNSKRPIRQRLVWLAVVPVGLAIVGGASLDVEVLRDGGLAPIAVAAVVAAFLGVPVAVAGRRVAREPDRTGPLASAITASGWFWSTALVAALVAPWARHTGIVGVLLVAAGWALAVLGVRFLGDAAAVIGAGLAAVVALGVAASGSLSGIGWTLLEPRWDAWTDWGPAAVVLGVLVSSAAMGTWERGPRPLPGTARVPWFATGVGLLVAVAAALRLASSWEAGTAPLPPDPMIGALCGVAALAGAAVVLSRPAAVSTRYVQAAAGLGLTLWFAGPAADALPVFWHSLLPLGLAVHAVLVATTDRAVRLPAGIAAAVLAAVAVVGFPGLPSSTLGAVAIGATIVVAAWVSGTRALLQRSA